ncbi:alpha/beta hydrolase [Nocardioides anomalus]|uniref:Alpha/beta hydrolase n=1 Tax=Nocardioides anomalus TaxID=2712223 RepID=A0A6G6W9M4_9ACTN|nr:alpha/beta hydrolase [Nocardioides anomalus]QIG42051.1 alpha/beta hydrolase [Nocardioides anomalus]
MNHLNPTVLLVHGAFAESASWNGVIKELHGAGTDAVAVANPLRSLSGDASYLRDVIASTEGPVILAGHSYGGMVITQAAADNPKVQGLVYVAAFAPDTGESAVALSGSAPGSTLGQTLEGRPLNDGTTELSIRLEAFHEQFCADVDAPTAALMARTQRPVTEAALTEGLPTSRPAWRSLPSWFVLGTEDRNIPAAAIRAEAARAGARGTHELTGASHAISVSRPFEVAATIAQAVAACRADHAA